MNRAATYKRRKIMKKQVKDELTKMVKVFNNVNEEKETGYHLECNRFARGKYACTISYNYTFNSIDLNALIKFVQRNSLGMFLGQGRIYIQ